MTLPSLIGNYQKIVTVNRLKKIYSLFQQSINMAKSKYGEETFIPDCNDAFDCYLNNDQRFWLLEDLKPKPCEGKALDSYVDTIKTSLHGYTQYVSSNQCYVLNDGTTFFYTGSYGYLLFLTDINGYKKPNKFAKDLFVFIYVPHVPMVYPKMSFGPYMGSIAVPDEGKPGLYPSGYPVAVGVANECTKNRPSGTCTNKIMQDGWQIKDDYPW